MHRPNTGDVVCNFFHKNPSNKRLRKRKHDDDNRDNGGDEEQQCRHILKQADDALKGNAKSSGDEKVYYKGIHCYTAGFQREQMVAGEKAGGAHGPRRAFAYIPLSARFDYQPNICKDYKEKGYCGFGDACKFMHDRGL